jgi:hypothetical protein
MAEQTQAGGSLNARDLELIKTLIAEVTKENKKPYVDEDVVAKKLAARTRLRAEQAEMVRNIEAMQAACSHLREDNTSAVAWAENFHRAKGFYIKEGPCQRCSKNFHPGVEGYEDIIRISTGKMGVIF